MNAVESPESRVEGQPVTDIFAARAREVTEFCLAHGAKLFADWPVPTLFAYVFFNVVDRTCFVVREHGQIAGVLFAQALDAAEQQRRQAARESSFNWRRSAEKSDAIALREVIARQDLLPRLARQITARWPDWRQRRVFTYRAGELVELKPAVIARFLRETHGKS
jgi:hypothetical protein